jgi:hypothetical protein
MTTKVADNKGRVTLGERYANRTVIVEEIDETEVRVTLARVIPEREAWLHDNPRAKGAVARGIAQAKAGKVNRGPDMTKARRIADRITDGDE